MNRKIVVQIDDDKSISIKKDGIEKIRMSVDKRQINAKDLYDLFDYSKGTTYDIELDNPNQLDKLALNEFISLLNTIKDQLETLNEDYLN